MKNKKSTTLYKAGRPPDDRTTGVAGHGLPVEVRGSSALYFVGKNKVWDYHEAVAPCSLTPIPEKGVGKGDGLDGNLIIHGDNLLALRSLQPTLAGAVKCVYIDPPYNTGWGKWVYSDKISRGGAPSWLGKLMEVESMSSRDLWLCAMTPTLHLLRTLLRDDGLVLISIDANEMIHLALLCDEIFGEANRVGVIIVRNNPRGRRFGTELAVEHEYLLAYAKNTEKFTAGRLALDDRRRAEYPHVDGNGKRHRLLGLRKRGAISSRAERPNLHYPLYVNPQDKSVSAKPGKELIEILPRRSDGSDGVWRWCGEKVERDREFLVARKVKRRSGAMEWDVFQIDHLERPDGAVSGRLFPSIWQGTEFNNERGRDQLREVFGESVFDYPKPVDLVKSAILLANARGGDIVLDCFAGSGTTCQAVMELNALDSGGRRFIAVEREPFADHITAERARRLIKGIPASKRELLRKGLGGEFTYAGVACSREGGREGHG